MLKVKVSWLHVLKVIGNQARNWNWYIHSKNTETYNYTNLLGRYLYTSKTLLIFM